MGVILACKGSSSDLARYEPNSIEMRCDRGLMWFPSRYNFYAPLRNHSMSLLLFKVVAVLVCKRSSSDLVRHETNSIEMRCDKTQNILAVRDAP